MRALMLISGTTAVRMVDRPEPQITAPNVASTDSQFWSKPNIAVPSHTSVRRMAF